MVRTRAGAGVTCCKEILSEVLVDGGEVEPKDVTFGAQVNERLDHLAMMQLHTLDSLVE